MLLLFRVEADTFFVIRRRRRIAAAVKARRAGPRAKRVPNGGAVDA